MAFMPVIIIGIIMIFVVFPAVLLSGIAKVKRAQSGGAAENSVRMGELEERIQHAVAAANEPLREEIRALEHKLDAILEERPLMAQKEVGRLAEAPSRDA